jgi:hypothetical protein
MHDLYGPAVTPAAGPTQASECLADADGAAAPFDCHAVAGTVPG